MNTKTSSFTVDTSSLTTMTVNEFVIQPYNYQKTTNASSSSISIDMRNMKLGEDSDNKI